MSIRYWLTMMMMCVAMMMISGCRTGRGDSSDAAVGEGGMDIGDEQYALTDRFPTDHLITDVVFNNVQYEYDSYQIMDSEVSKIEQVADFMRQNPRANLICEGHCDERGSRVYNMSLGEGRAHAVRAYLIGLNISGYRIQTKSLGEETPLDPGHGESAWRLNRRVEFVLYR